MNDNRLKLIFLFSFRENVLLVIRKIASVLNPKTDFGRPILEEKKSFAKMLSQGYRLEKEGPRNVLRGHFDHAKSDFCISVRRYSSDVKVFHQIVVNQEYSPVFDFIERKRGNNEIKYVIDAGANIGLTTIHIKSVYDKAEIVAVEPDSENYQMLVRNISLNDLKKVHALRAAVWHKNDELFLDTDFRDGEAWSISVSDKIATGRARASVQGLNIVTIMDKYNFDHIDLLKIDIEGAERFLFADSDTASAFLSVTRFIAMEIHNEYNITEKIKTILDQNGFEYFFSGELIIGFNSKIKIGK
jgi:FkbM family methyltransferase